MRAHKAIISCNLTEKNRQYLVRLGLIDERTGRSKKTKFGTASEIINQALTIVLEDGMHPQNAIASNEDLMAAWRKFNIRQRSREIERLQQEMQAIANWKGE